MHILQLNGNDNNQNFKSLNSVKIKGRLFKKNPRYAEKMLAAVNDSKEIREFSDKWDSSIVIKAKEAHNHNSDNVQTSLKLFYDKPSKGVEKFFRSILSKKNYAYFIGFGYNLKESVEQLAQSINKNSKKLFADINNLEDTKVSEKAALAAKKKQERKQRDADFAKLIAERKKFDNMFNNFFL